MARHTASELQPHRSHQAGRLRYVLVRVVVALAALSVCVVASGCSAGEFAADQVREQRSAEESQKAESAGEFTQPGSADESGEAEDPDVVGETQTEQSRETSEAPQTEGYGNGADQAGLAQMALAPTPERAAELLETLAVKGRAPKTGYSRDQFGQRWKDVDRNGCDQRNDVLARDLANAHAPGGCKVLSGTLQDPYTGRTIEFQRGQGTSEKVQIDHVVPLADAWQKGAQQWTPQRREEFANDIGNLLAVDGPANQKKGAGDAATWLPAHKPFRCAYVSIQVDVKARHGLWVTQAEHDAIRRVLDQC